MIEQENAQAEIEIEDIEVQIEDQDLGDSVSSDQELQDYSKSVSKRINKKNQEIMAAKEESARLREMLAQKDVESTNYRIHTNATIIQKEEESLQNKELQADDLYKKAVASGDADLMSKADTLKSELSIQKEKVRMAKAQSEQQTFNNPQVVQQEQNYRQQEQQQQQQPQPTSEALSWHEENSWYQDESSKINQEATQYAAFTHLTLANEGYEIDSNEYYSELNSRIKKVFPDLQSGQSVAKEEGKPAVQRVTSASVGSRQKTQGKKNGVTFSKSEVERLKGLKPHNMSNEVWLKSVAKEKQKIANREAK